MKTKSLTTWCNLYSTASKFNISVFPSRYQRLAQHLALIVFTAVLASIFTLSNSFSVSAVALFNISAVILAIAYLSWRSSAIRLSVRQYQAQQKPQTVFVLNLDGCAQFAEQPKQALQLDVSSRKGLWGCRLNFCLADQAEHAALDTQVNLDKKAKLRAAQVVKSVFIYKDSVSEQDYRRISRVLLAVKSAR